MKFLDPILIVFVALCFLESGCQKDEVVSCDPFGGSIVEQLLINTGEPGLASDINTYLISNGALIMLTHANKLGATKSSLGGSYIDKYYSNNNSAIKPGLIQVDGKFLSSWNQSGLPFKMNVKDSTLIPLFDGGNHSYLQFNQGSTTVLNTQSIRIPKAFSQGDQLTTLQKKTNGIQLDWPSSQDTNFVVIIAHATSDGGMVNASTISENDPFYFVKKVPDNGQILLPFSDFAQLPTGAICSIDLYRVSYKLFQDTRDSQRKNLLLFIAKSLGSVKKDW
jgi:hypothetical protein